MFWRFGIARRQPPRRGDRLAERCVNATRPRIDERGKGVEIGALELRDLPVLHEQRGQRMPLFGELLQNGDVGRWAGRRALQDRQPESFEQDLAQLRRRVDVELLARGLIDLLLDALPLPRKALFEGRKPDDVDADARPLHLGEHLG